MKLSALIPGSVRRMFRRGPSRVRAKYEAASATHRNLWPGADMLSADAAASPAVRKTLRERCRTQVENDPIAAGIVETLAFDLVGAGPRLQVMLPDEEANDAIERAFHAWADSVCLAEKLQAMRRARATDGEAFALLVSNPQIDNPVKLDVQLVEADQVTSASLFADATDGIKLDEWGNPESYTILTAHPGDISGNANPAQFKTVPADSVIHYFRARRPGQHRGIPDIAPALMRFAYMQRFTLATIVAAENAANHAMVIQTNLAPDGAAAVDPLDQIELDRSMATTLPEGWTLGQVDAQHPATTFEMFRREIVGDIARCVQMPLNVALLNSSKFNFASGRLDWLVYNNSIRVERGHLERIAMCRIVRAWANEASLVSDLLPPNVRAMIPAGGALPHAWVWPGSDHPVDPAKEASAANDRMAGGLSSLADEFGRKGQDWREKTEQRYVEAAFRKSMRAKYGVEEADLAMVPAPDPAAPAPDEAPVQETDE